MLQRREILQASALALTTLLGACGGSSSNTNSATTNTTGPGKMRLVNATVGYPSINMAVDGVASVSNLAFGSTSPLVGYGNASVVTSITDAATGSLLESQTRSLSSNHDTTVVAYGLAGAVRTYHIIETEPAPAAGSVKVRVLNLAGDAGSLSVYLTTDAATLGNATPAVAGVGAGLASGYATMSPGTYRVRITGATDSGDLRLDASGLVLPDTGVLTLVVVPTTGGTLVTAVVLPQGATTTIVGSNLVRLRAVASVAENAGVSVTVGNTLLLDGVRSPTIGSYALGASGLLPLAVTVNGVVVAAPNVAAVAGQDLTVLVYGTASAPRVSVLNEVNRLPTGTGAARIRLMHAASSLAASALTLTVNFAAAANSVPYGSASAYVDIPAGTAQQLDVADPLTLGAVYNLTGATLAVGGLYTVYVVMGTNGPVGVLRRER